MSTIECIGGKFGNIVWYKGKNVKKVKNHYPKSLSGALRKICRDKQNITRFHRWAYDILCPQITNA